MRFAKGHGTENDFVILPDPDAGVMLTPGLVARLCDRRAGLGGDGLLRVVRTAALAGAAGPDAAGAEWFMDYWNGDGSLAEMCGNGIRVFARYLLDHGLAVGPEIAVATRAGVRLVRAEPDGAITVDMGTPQVLGAGHAVLAGQPLTGLAVSMGNPHLACLVAGPLDGFSLSAPPGLDAAEFPAGANLELVRLAGAGHVQMLVYERGSGPTRSCGTGAVAAAVAAALAGQDPAPGTAPPPGHWTVDLPGGRLRVTLDGRSSFLSGPAVIVAAGELSRSWLSGPVAGAVHSSPTL